jgi:hypothetical protein
MLRRVRDACAGPRAVIPVLAAIAVLWAFLGFLSPGGHGGEDHVAHHLVSRYAFQHPVLFLNQWGKPLFTLLSSPFSQFGIAGTALFNILVAIATAFFTMKTANVLNAPFPHFAAYFVIFAPQFFVLAFSSMTEPLFACLLAAALFAWFSGRHALSCAIMSFLPFARQEGYIFLGIWAAMSVIQRRWHLLLYLAIGPTAFAALGAVVHGDLAWIASAFPYRATPYRAVATDIYGSGDLWHYARRLVLVVGPVILWHFVVGFHGAPILLRTCWLAFFLAHSFAWWQGMFASLGLERVFVSVVPITALIALPGLQRTLSRQLSLVDGCVAVLATLVGAYALVVADTRLLQLYCLVFLGLAGIFLLLKVRRLPLAPVHSVRAIFPLVVLLLSASMPFLQFRLPVALTQEQRLISTAAEWLKTEHLDQRPMSFDYPFLAVALGIDYFDAQRRTNLRRFAEDRTEPGSVVVWDGHFGPNEAGVDLERLRSHPGYRLLRSFKPEVEITSLNKSPFEIHVFERTAGPKTDPSR